MDPVHMQPHFYDTGVRFKTKNVNVFSNFIKNKVNVMLGTFLNFVYDTSYLGAKKYMVS